jgi:oligopeptide transport system substrate-binding protein
VIVNNVLQGGQIPAYFFTPPATADFKAPDLEIAKMTQADRDAKAKQLLADAGYGPDKPVEFTYIYNTSVAHQQIATVVSQMLKEKLGINMALQDMEFATLIEKRHQRDFDVSRDAWCGDYNEASTFDGLLTSTSSQNNSGYANADVDKWFTESATSKDPNSEYLKIEEQIAKDIPIIPIYFYTKVFLQKTDIGGWPYDNVEQVWYAKDLYKTAG